MSKLFPTIAILAATAGPLQGQAHEHHAGMDHRAGMMHGTATGPMPSQPGQAAFGAISEVVRLLMADSTTDWRKVDIEGLRQHLIDMNNVIMSATVTAADVPGGVRLEVQGQGPVAASVRRMVVAHAQALDAMPEFHARGTASASGATLEVTAKAPGDEQAAARIRGLGLAGLLAVGDHHMAHHLMIARGEPPARHEHAH